MRVDYGNDQAAPARRPSAPGRRAPNTAGPAQPAPPPPGLVRPPHLADQLPRLLLGLLAVQRRVERVAHHLPHHVELVVLARKRRELLLHLGRVHLLLQRAHRLARGADGGRHGRRRGGGLRGPAAGEQWAWSGWGGSHVPAAWWVRPPFAPAAPAASGRRRSRAPERAPPRPGAHPDVVARALEMRRGHAVHPCRNAAFKTCHWLRAPLPPHLPPAHRDVVAHALELRRARLQRRHLAPQPHEALGQHARRRLVVGLCCCLDLADQLLLLALEAHQLPLNLWGEGSRRRISVEMRRGGALG